MVRLNKVIRALGYCIAILVILAALLACISQLLTPYLNKQLPYFEKRASDVLHAPVSFKKIKLSWFFLTPEIYLQEVVIQNPAQKTQIKIDSVELDIDIFSTVLHVQPILGLIKINGINLTVRQPTSETIVIEEFKNLAPTDQSISAKGQDDFLTWFAQQSKFTITKVNIDYYLPSNAKKTLYIPYLNLKNNSNFHSLKGTVILDQAISTKAKIDLEWHGKLDDFSEDVNLNLYLEGITLPQWLSQFSWHDLQLIEGLGSVKIWAKWDKKKIQALKTQFQFYDLKYTSSLTHESQHIPRLSGKVNWQLKDQKQIIRGEDILIDLPEHLWPTFDFSTVLTKDASGMLQLEQLKVNYLELSETINFLIKAGLVTDKFKQQLLDLKVGGEVTFLNIKMPLSGQGFSPSVVEAQLNNFSFSTLDKFPGLENLTGKFTWQNQQGEIVLASKRVRLNLPQVFNSPLTFAELTGNVTFQKSSADNTWQFSAKQLRANSKDLTVLSDMQLSIPIQGAPTIKLTADFSVAHVENLVRYLPMKTFDAELSSWLQAAFIKGEMVAGKALLQGNLSNFPFTKQDEKFSISANLKDVELNYGQAWPHLHKLAGVLTFEGNSMAVAIHSGSLLDIPLGSVHAVIPVLTGKEASILTVQSQMIADLAQGLDFIHKSPLQKTLGKKLALLQINGPMTLKLDLTLPLENMDATQVAADLTTQHASIHIPAVKLKLDELAGTFHFTENAISSMPLTAKLFNEPVRILLSTPPEGKQSKGLHVDVEGVVKIASLQTWLDRSFAPYIQGAANYKLQLQFPNNNSPPQLTLESDLKGITINIPHPYGKTTDETRDLKLDLWLSPNAPLVSKIYYADLLSAALSFSDSPQGLQFERGQVYLGKAVPILPTTSGLTVVARFKELNKAALRPYLDMTRADKTVGTKSSKTALDPKFFSRLIISADKVNLYGIHLNDARISAMKINNDWVLKINSTQIVGDLTLSPNFSRIQGKFQRLYLMGSNEKREAVKPQAIPALSITATDFRYENTMLGAVTLETESNADGMQIKSLQVNTGEGNFNAVGSWNGARSQLNGTLTTERLTPLLLKLGLNASALVAKKGDVQFDLNWPGAPYDLGLKALSGTFSFHLGPGKIINLGEGTETKLGFGRILNLLSLQSLPSRLSLNFSDVFEKGYSFNHVKGDYKLVNGDAFTTNMRIAGSIASVSLTGRIGLAAKNYDLLLGVAAHVTSSLPVLATMAFNPIVGVAAWAVDKVVSNQVSKMTTSYYRVTGPWDNPVWVKSSQSAQ